MEKWEMRDLGQVSYSLGIEVIRNRSKREIMLSQRKFARDVLSRFNMLHSRPVSTPLPSGVKLTKDDCPTTPEAKAEMDVVSYLSAIGSLAIGTRSDLFYVALSCFNYNPGRVHWEALMHILRYLATQDLALRYGPI